ncbi:hypothetical protein CROQUDRAFT_471533 [Cronartium quercuum f. sp. fusiforme G11]|uniref:Uncharacterized protein n=1 Tax=Cronartium quercuum f. sp. fusiforme G11 TaxID=708437 RepID=A0A9P6TD66_9BASI|nr:hypothetical protein CROQUDRAFT_471533 [Cronartium quercuum f. sp. fusiforme G11]
MNSSIKLRDEMDERDEVQEIRYKKLYIVIPTKYQHGHLKSFFLFFFFFQNWVYVNFYRLLDSRAQVFIKLEYQVEELNIITTSIELYHSTDDHT